MRALLACLFVLGLPGCASIVTGTKTTTLVESHDGKGNAVVGADCTLKNSQGEWHVKTPQGTQIDSAYGDLVVRCDANGYPPGQATVVSSLKGMFAGNILFGGVIGMGIDAASGAAYEYPSLIRIKLGDSIVIAPARNEKGTTRWHHDSSLLPPRTDWAALGDVDQVPLPRKGQESYRRFLATRYPRAFAIGPGNTYIWSANNPQAAADALEKCAAVANAKCALYAVDDYVVWSDTVAAGMGARARRTVASATASRGVHDAPEDLPARTGWAAVDDLSAFPIRSERGQESYRQWLLLPVPKVFAIGPGGTWGASNGNSGALGNAIRTCEAGGRIRCRVYAIDDYVVWSDTANAETLAETWVPQTQEMAGAPAGSLDDADAVPFVGERGRQGYADFLRQRSPRAFAVSEGGFFGWSGNRPDAPERALQYCQKQSRSPCALYVIDERVVWPQRAPGG